jgi:hypothetical protein
MTTVAVLTDPPHPEVALPDIVAETPLSNAEAVGLYTALLNDTVLAAERSGGEVLINYRSADALGLDIDSEATIRDALGDVYDPETTRFEVQVGETFAGRAGNTATHLLETEDVGSVGITRPEAALLARTDIDGAAMKLRSSPVILQAAPDGRVTYAAFREPIDFADGYTPPAVETLTDRALDAGLGTEFLETKPCVERERDLAELIVTVRTRLKADALVPPALGAWVAETDLVVSIDDDGRPVIR